MATTRRERETGGPGAQAEPRLAGPGRRLWGYVLENVFFVVTLGVGWIVWFAFVAPKGTSPGKQAAGTVVLRDGRLAGAGTMWARDVAIKIFLGALVLSVPVAGWIAVLLACLWCCWDRQRQCAWDKMAGTVVVMAR